MPDTTDFVLRLCMAAVVFGAVTANQTVAAQAGATGTAAAQKPNVIMVFTDDMGYGDVSSFAKTPLKVKTPNIDRLAKEGMKFTQFYVAMPICSPSRASVLSGMHAPETQITTYLQERKGNKQADQNDFLSPALAFLPKTFAAGGYATAHVGKWHLGGGRDVDNAPSISEYGYKEFWSTWESPEPDPKLGSAVPSWNDNKPPTQLDRWKTTGYMVDRTLDFMKRNQGTPTFVTLWPEDVHTPFTPSPEGLKKHGGKTKEGRSLENFYGVLEEYDREMGRLLDGLKTQGMEDNTILFFTSDNGPNPDFNRLRTDGMRGSKGTLYEGGIREPFIIRWPGHIPAGTQNDVTVLSAIDLLPTLSALVGIPVVPESIGKADGEDLSKAMFGQPVKRTTPLLYEFGRTRPAKPRPNNKDRGPQLAIREGDLKVLVNRDGSDLQMYNVVKDRNETTNIADQQSTAAKEMSKKLLDWSKTLPSRTHPFPAK